jgi:hypothetical protein
MTSLVDQYIWVYRVPDDRQFIPDPPRAHWATSCLLRVEAPRWLQAPAGGCAVHPRRRQDQIGRRVKQPIVRPRWSTALLPEQHATHRYGRRSHFASPARLATVAQCRPDMDRTGQAPEPGRSERAEIRRQAAEAGSLPRAAHSRIRDTPRGLARQPPILSHAPNRVPMQMLRVAGMCPETVGQSLPDIPMSRRSRR